MLNHNITLWANDRARSGRPLPKRSPAPEPTPLAEVPPTPTPEPTPLVLPIPDDNRLSPDELAKEIEHAIRMGTHRAANRGQRAQRRDLSHLTQADRDIIARAYRRAYLAVYDRTKAKKGDQS